MARRIRQVWLVVGWVLTALTVIVAAYAVLVGSVAEAEIAGLSTGAAWVVTVVGFAAVTICFLLPDVLRARRRRRRRGL
jgi:uncharacterized membrane protein